MFSGTVVVSNGGSESSPDNQGPLNGTWLFSKQPREPNALLAERQARRRESGAFGGFSGGFCPSALSLGGSDHRGYFIGDSPSIVWVCLKIGEQPQFAIVFFVVVSQSTNLRRIP